MSALKKTNIGHSVFQRLLNHARTQDEDFNFLLLRYGLERFLYRLSISSHSNDFILKGASLFLVWCGQNYRATKDVDFLSFGSADPEQLTDIFKDICQINITDDDGIVFSQNTVRAEPIRENNEYDGVRVTLKAFLNQAQIPLQIDIGFGDVITPGAEQIIFPTLLDSPPPRLLAYPRYTTVAEKFETMVRLGIANSRMKDFYDVWLLNQLFEFKGRILSDAIRTTFGRRSTQIPDTLPIAFTDEFYNDPQKQTQWRAFVRKAKPEIASGNLDAVIDGVTEFLMPIIDAINGNQPFGSLWANGGPWNEKP